jgi:hypothetical protein
VIAAAEPERFVMFTGIVVVGEFSLLKPNAPGLIRIVCELVVITSVIIPAPGAGSVVDALDASAVLDAASEYIRTQAAADV